MSAIRDDPRFLRFLEATREVVKPGGPFELAREVVLGQPMDVYRNRHRSLTALLQSAGRFGTRDYFVTDDGRRLTYGELCGGGSQPRSWAPKCSWNPKG